MLNYGEELSKLEEAGQLRGLKEFEGSATNFSTNDYLGLGADEALQAEFYSLHDAKSSPLYRCGSTSSRLLSGNHQGYGKLEEALASAYNCQAALVFNSGYHANIGLLAALSTKKDLILSDKLNHASIVDGCKLASAKTIRFKHADLSHLKTLLEKNHQDFERIFIITESIFSMDGDLADLISLVGLKKKYNAFLIVDEAHGVGVRGQKGLGLCEELNLIQEVDLIVGTFGKALASSGAYAICSNEVKLWLINQMRSLIFTTALSPVIVQWNLFIFEKMQAMNSRRLHLKALADFCCEGLKAHFPVSGQSHIIPIMVGENHKTVDLAAKAREEGFILFPIRPPTVPVGTSRLRLSLSSALTEEQILPLLKLLVEEMKR